MNRFYALLQAGSIAAPVVHGWKMGGIGAVRSAAEWKQSMSPAVAVPLVKKKRNPRRSELLENSRIEQLNICNVAYK